LTWFCEGVTTKEIASRLTKDVSEVKKIIRENKTLPPAATPPTPQEAVPVSPVQWPSAKIIGCAVTPYNTRSRELKEVVIGWSTISVRTIQKICPKKLGLPSRCAAKKPLLTIQMVKKRIAFSKKYRPWTEKDWEVMLSDESSFMLVNLRAQRVSWLTQTNRYKQGHVVVNMKHSVSVMVWGMFQWRRGLGLPVFPPSQDHSEEGKIHGDAAREAHLLVAS
jgi:hypothetical protein